MRRIFQKLNLLRKHEESGRRRKALNKRPSGVRVENLEPRRLLAVDVFSTAPLAGQENWVNVLTDNGDDVFVQHVANSDRDMFVASNSSFFNAEEIPDFLSTYDSLNIYEGSNIVRSGVTRVNAPYGNENENEVFTFFLPYGGVNTEGEISGTIVVGDDEFDFSNGGSGTGLQSGGLPNGGDIQLTVFDEYTQGSVTRIQLRHPNFRGIASTQDVRLASFTFEATTDNLGNTFRQTLFDLPASSDSAAVTFSPYETGFWSAGQYIPGSLRGSLRVEFVGGVNQIVPFQVNTTEVSIDDPNLGRTLIPLAFEDIFAPGVERDLAPTWTVTTFDNDASGDYGVAETHDIVLTGTFDSISGEIRLATTFGDDGIEVGSNISIINSEIGRYDPAAIVAPPTAALFPGLTHTVGLNVELPTAGSRILIDSPVVTAGTNQGQGDVLLAASDVRISAPVFAAETITVPSTSNSLLGTTSEKLIVNAATSSPAFTIQLADDPATESVTKSQLVVTQSGSISATPDVLNVPPAVLAQADTVFVEVVEGDAFIEGTVAANLQSYVMSSQVGSENEAPYVLTTRSRLTGLDTGSVVGDILSLTLGNDTLGEDFLSLATSEVSLSTDINRLRTQASSRAGDVLEEMFPYKLLINETNNLIVDAVAGSSEAVEISAGGSLSLLGAIQSQHDILLESAADFQVSAPVSTAFGRISMVGPNVTVNSSVRILDAIQDERFVDILIESTDPTGGLVLNDAISALNRVELVAAGSVTGNARVRGDVVDVDANGDVSFSTAANLVTVDTPGSVRVEDEGAVAFEIRQSPDVTLIANGVDRLVDHDFDATTADVLSPALYADVYDTSEIVVSAPKGSVDVLHIGAQPVVVGDIAGINAGVEVSPGSSAMLAGGSAIVRSTLSSQITVRDFPAALSGGEKVRFGTTEPLPAGASYTPGGGEPGTNATLLRVNLSYGDSGKRLPVFDNVLASQIRVGDKILIKDGKYEPPEQEGQDSGIDGSINGIYVILGVNFINADKVEFTLVRSQDFDETPEMEGRSYVTVTGVADPDAQVDVASNTLAGRSFASTGFDVVSPLVRNYGAFGEPATPFEVNRVPSQPGYVVARAATSQPIRTEAYFSEGKTNSDLIEETVDAATNSSTVTVNTQATQISKIRPGYYVTGPDTRPVPEGTTVVTVNQFTNQITLSNSVTLEQDDELGFSKYKGGLWLDEIIASSNGFIDQSNYLFNGVQLGLNDIVLVPLPVGAETFGEGVGALTDAAIGLYEVASVGDASKPWRLRRYQGVDETGDGYTNFVTEALVTVAEGDLRTAVSGEMFKLSYRALHAHDYNYQALTDYKDSITFDRENTLNSILPPFDTNAQVRTDIGSDNPNGNVAFEISTNGGTNTAAGSFGRMLSVLQSNSAAIARTRAPQPYSTSFSADVTNIVLEQQLPSITSPIELSGPAGLVSIDGSEITLTRDGAVVPTGTITAGIGPVRPSQVETARRLVRSSDVGGTFLNGLEFGPGAEGSTLSNLRLGGFNTGAAIYIGGANNILVDNVTLGRDQVNSPLPNRYGVYVAQSAGGNGTDYTTISNSTIVSSSDTGIYLGVNADNVRLVGNDAIGFAAQGNNTGVKIESLLGRNLIGTAPIVEPVGNIAAVARSNKIRLLPDSVNRDDLYLGQEVSDYLGAGVIPAGTVISKIEEIAGGQIELTLSNELTDTATISISFDSLGQTLQRNEIQFNSDGVILGNGASRMVMTDVVGSVFDGVVINGVSESGEHVIGGVEYVGVVGENIQNASNNAIHSNGLSGIKFTDAFFSGLSEAAKVEKVNKVKIRGNYLGLSVDSVPGLSGGQTNGRDGASNIVIEQSLDQNGNPTPEDSNAGIRAILLEDATPGDDDPRDGGLYYTARYRAEDNPDSNPDLDSREGIDQEGNVLVAGDPISGTPGVPSGPIDPDDPRRPSEPPVRR